MDLNDRFLLIGLIKKQEDCLHLQKLQMLRMLQSSLVVLIKMDYDHFWSMIRDSIQIE